MKKPSKKPSKGKPAAKGTAHKPTFAKGGKPYSFIKK
jgi:hypothetical protein